ncbi:SPOSA6832_01814 [Sporobolomyces salmonicolor]|uniref:SPOSA6832_01814-mRNA-1:cds n=1 Tax=Sporidiobolus salmonicolor TaxID=5005 RepID=A0A0D6EKV3_SPOSA|nr:SPOSA6832_01814 [Sporobolomyces salmonicolor]
MSSNASALLSALNSRPTSAQPPSHHPYSPFNDSPSSPGIAHGALDPWGSSAINGLGGAASASSHLPLSISQSINNPGLPSGVIVSSAAVNAMNGLADAGPRDGAHGRGGGGSGAPSQGGLSRSETPGLPNGAGALAPGQGGGKLLLQGGVPLATSSLIQPGSIPGAGSAQTENEKVYYLIVDLMNVNTREAALLELSKKREQWDDLALVLWHSFGVMSALLQEIVSVYPLLAPPSLTAHASNRVCNALALLQCVASHNDTRSLFLSAHIPLFLYPFLNTTSKTRPFEYLRLTSLGVIGALVKQNDNSDVINFLLSTEIIPLCLRIMETGSELSKTVAIFIVQKILLDEMGLGYICQTYERFYAVGTVLSNMVQQLVETQAVRLLKHVVRCYLRLSDNLRAREALRACLPEPLRDATFSPLLKGDMVTKRCLATLLLNLSDRVDSV